jgi:general L-amino acid transport system substrate-binding protein
LNMVRKMNRSGFVKAVGAGVAGAAGAAMLGSGVASAMPGEGPTVGNLNIGHPRKERKLGVAVPENNYGFFSPDASPPVHPTGIEADFARAIAAAIFGETDPYMLDNHIDYRQSDSTERFRLLYNKEVDVILRGCTHSIARDIYWTADPSIPKAGYEFGVPYFYDGADVLVVKNLPPGTKPRIGVGSGTTTEEVITQPPYNQIFDVVVYPGSSAAREAFELGEVDGYSSDRTILIGTQLKIAETTDPNSPLYGLETEIYFSEREGRVLSREPLAACVREDDFNWKDIVNMVFMVLREAELKNITQANVDASTFGLSGAVDKYPDLIPGNPDWPRDIIRAVGNYSEIWKRNFDPYGSAYYVLSRGQNALHTNDGLHYPHPSF